MTHAPAGQPCHCGERGWMPGVEHIPIRWQRPSWLLGLEGKMQPVVIVDHIMQGYLQTMVDWASNGGSKVIAHFGISRGGRIVQFQDVFTPGIHASALNLPTAVRVLARASARHGANGFSVGLEHEGCSVRPPYNVPPDLIYSATNPWPAAMVQASLRVKRWLFNTCPTLGQPSRDSIIGHSEIDAKNRPDDPQARTDRGVWPRDRFIRDLAPAPAQLTPEQQEAVAYLQSADGQRLPAAEQARILGLVGLSAMPGAPPPAVPAPAPGPAPAATTDDSEWRAGYAAAARYFESRINLVVNQSAVVRAEATHAAASPPARK